MSGQLSVLSGHDLTMLTCALGSDEERTLLDQHLAECPACRHRYRFFRQIVNLSHRNGHPTCTIWIQTSGEEWHVVAITGTAQEVHE
jgi:hypothetical protein